MKRAIGLLALALPCAAQTTPLPNLYPVCVQACYVDSNSYAGAQYQYGDMQSNVWASSFTNPTYPLFVNYTNGSLLGMPSVWTAAATPTTLYVQQTSVVQTIQVHNLDPQSWTVTVPALATTTTAVSGAAATPVTTVAVQPSTTSAPVVPQMSTSCTVPKNGGRCTITFPQQTLPPLAVPGQTLSLPSTSGTYSFSCTGTDMQHLACTVTKQ